MHICRDHVPRTWRRRRIAHAYARTYTWRRRHMLVTGGVSDAKAMTGDVGAVSDGRHNRLRVSAASPACWGRIHVQEVRARDALLPLPVCHTHMH